MAAQNRSHIRHFQSEKQVESQEKSQTPLFDVLIIGGGPGGIGAAISILDRMEQLQFSLSIGIIESYKLGGKLSGNFITANSSAYDFLEGIENTSVKTAMEHPSARRLQTISAMSKKKPPQLFEAGDFYEYGIGEEIKKILPKDAIIKEYVAMVISDINVYTAISDNGEKIALGKHLILATGAKEILLPSLLKYKNKVIFSGEMFTEEKLPDMENIILSLPFDQRKIVVVGSSHSAWATVHKVLKVMGKALPEGAIEVVARSPTKLYFETFAEASAIGYPVSDGDICPKTGRVNRFGAIQHDAKATFLSVTSGAEKRVIILSIKDLSQIDSKLNNASCIIQATGYSTKKIDIMDISGNVLGPLIDAKGRAQMTNKAQILNIQRIPIPRVYGIGLGYDGVGPTPAFGGQPNYRGSLHSVNVYRSLIGPMIAEQIISRSPTQTDLHPHG